MNLPITADNRVTQFILDLLGRFKVVQLRGRVQALPNLSASVWYVSAPERKKALKFNLKTMVVYPVLAGLTLVGLCFISPSRHMGNVAVRLPASRVLYAFCSVVGTMLVHQGLDGIAKYYNHKVGEDRFNFENESFEQSRQEVNTLIQ